jgi:CMP-N,N'-diacetyllegionaminic acid synthase
VLPVPAEYNPHWVYFRDEKGLLRLSTGEDTPIPRRQSLPPAFHREGSVYVVRRDVLMEGNSFYGQRFAGYLLDPAMSANIDTMEDWQRAEHLLSRMASGQQL